jgi:hypothetical protein
VCIRPTRAIRGCLLELVLEMRRRPGNLRSAIAVDLRLSFDAHRVAAHKPHHKRHWGEEDKKQ